MLGGPKSPRLSGGRAGFAKQRGFVNLGLWRKALGGSDLRPALDLQFTNDATLDPRITYSGGAGGTYIDSTGTMRPQRGNALIQSADLTQAAWTKSNTTTPTVDKIIEDGTNATHYVKNSAVPAGTWTFSVEVLPLGRNFIRLTTNSGGGGSLSAYFNLSGAGTAVQEGAGGTSSITALPNGWYLCVATGSTASFPMINLSTGTTAGSLTYQGDGVSGVQVRNMQANPGTQVISPVIPTTSAAVYAPRIDASGPSRTNLALWSQDYTQATWVKNFITASAAGVAAPDGSLTAQKLVPAAASNAYKSIQQSGAVPSSTTITVSFYVKAAEYSNVSLILTNNNGRVTFDLAGLQSTNWTSNGTASIKDVGNGWRRVQWTLTTSAAAGTALWIGAKGTYTDPSVASVEDGTSGVLVWGAQLETGSVATDYIWTTIAAGTVPAVRTNLYVNTAFAGAVAGSPGTGPTGWTQFTAGTPSLATPATGQITFTGATNDRRFISQQLVLVAGQTLTLAFDAVAITGSMSSGDPVALLNIQSGSFSSVESVGQINPASVVIGRNRISATAGASGATVNVRIGIGCGGTLTGAQSITITNPQLEVGAVATAYIANTSTTTSASSADIKGVLIEEQRTNSIRNSTMQGAVSGAAWPTNWSQTFNSITGLVATITAGNTEGGQSVIDVRFNGTPSATNAAGIQLFMETTTGIAATAGQVWSYSAYVSLIAGNFANVTQPQFNLQTYTSVPAFIQNNTANITIGSGSLLANRQSQAITVAGASTASIRPVLQFGVTAGQAIDFTIRIGGPQLELGAFATSFIPTTSAAVTRTADQAKLSSSNFSSIVNTAQGTFIAEFDAVQQTSAPVIFGHASTGTNGLSFNNLQHWNGTSALNSGRSVPLAGIASKAALTYTSNSRAFCVNGGALTNDANGIGSVDQITFGYANNTQYLNSHVKRIRYWRTKLPDATLQS